MVHLTPRWPGQHRYARNVHFQSLLRGRAPPTAARQRQAPGKGIPPSKHQGLPASGPSSKLSPDPNCDLWEAPSRLLSPCVQQGCWQDTQKVPTATPPSAWGLPPAAPARPHGHRSRGGDPTWPRSRVTLTSLYSSPRDSGGLCHQRSVPSMALLTGCALLLLAAVQMSQYWPWGGADAVRWRGWGAGTLPLGHPPAPHPRPADPLLPFPARSASTECLLRPGLGGSALGRDSRTPTGERGERGRRRAPSLGGKRGRLSGGVSEAYAASGGGLQTGGEPRRAWGQGEAGSPGPKGQWNRSPGRKRAGRGGGGTSPDRRPGSIRVGWGPGG